MKVAAIQYRPPKGCPSRARHEIAKLIDAAGEQGAGLIVCPEMATTGYIWPDQQSLRPHAEPPSGATFELLSELARAHQAWIVCGYVELGQVGTEAGDRLYNAALVVGPSGSLVASYRKVLLYDADHLWAQPGESRLLVETSWGQLVPGICMDLNDPGFIGLLHQRQPSLVAFCTNWIEEGIDVCSYWKERLAGWSGTFVAANSWGTDGPTRFSGRSLILGPRGRVLAPAAPEGDCVLIGEVADSRPR